VRKKVLQAVIILLLTGVSGYSQDTISISGVTVQAARIKEMSGYKQTRIDSLIMKEYSTNSFSDMLSRHSPVFIKSYGQGALATASFRGTNASHTKVRWNGVEINSSMLGQTDFSMIPVFMADQVILSHGGSSISQGSGALGGSISFKNDIDWAKDFAFNLIQDVGSFSTYKTSSALQLGNSNLQARTKFYYATSDNDFSFKNNFKDRENPPTEVRQHAGYSQSSLMQEFYWKPGGQDVVSAHFWGQDYSRNIAPPLGVKGTKRDENQKNRFLRSVVEWKRQLEQSVLKVRTAYLYDYLNYENDLADIDSDNYTHQWSSRAKLSAELSEKLELNSSIAFKNERVISDNYQGRKKRNTLTAFAGLEYTISDRLLTRLMLRQQVVDGRMIPVIPSAGLDYQLLKKEELYLKANISRNYRLPTLNDLYWSPGGNSNLKPEKGISWEVGVDYSKSLLNTMNFESSVTAYRSLISNWISWMPDSVMSYWTPRNYSRVVSKGIESNMTLSAMLGKTKLHTGISYYFTRTYNTQNSISVPSGEPAQFIYVPKHNYSVHGRIQRSRYTFSLLYRHTGRRFTSQENDAYMPAFELVDLSVGYRLSSQKLNANVLLKVNNVFDADYQVIAWRPMPGRNYHIVLKLNLFN